MSRKRELERQHEEHEAFKWLFGNALGMDGITGPGKALDCGGGNCVWAREFATSWPDCEVPRVFVVKPTPKLTEFRRLSLPISARFYFRSKTNCRGT